EWHVGRETLLRLGDDEARGRLRPGKLRELRPVHAAETRVEAAPTRHAVDVGGDVGRGELSEVLPAKGQRLLDIAENAEGPRRRIELGAGTRVQHGPLLGPVFAGRQARRVV